MENQLLLLLGARGMWGASLGFFFLGGGQLSLTSNPQMMPLAKPLLSTDN